MASNHNAVSTTFHDPISMLEASDVQSATQLRTILEKLHDCAAFLRDRIATQAEQETGTDTTKSVTPGRQQFHPSAAKFWAHVRVTAGTPAIGGSYNVTSITDAGTGNLIVTIATDFSASTTWACLHSIDNAAAALVSRLTSRTAGTAQFLCVDLAAVATDPEQWNIAGFGDQS